MSDDALTRPMIDPVARRRKQVAIVLAVVLALVLFAALH